jgi:hypothetical protein
MKKYLKIIHFLFLSTGILASCKKDNGNNNSTAQLPVVTTAGISAVTQTSATCGGNVTNIGGSAVTFRGVCWSTQKSPTIADSKTLDGSGLAIFTSSLTGLTDGATYYVRAYATNSFGTGYGKETSFYALVTGENYQGGLIAYIFQTGDPGYVEATPHGIIAAPSDQAPSTKWFNGNYTGTGASATALGTGNNNTDMIVNKQGAGFYAAKYCFDLVLGGHSDWHLPSKDELNKLYLSRKAVGDFSIGYYWSSTEAGDHTAWIQNFDNGALSSYDKNGGFRVRAIRIF